MGVRDVASSHLNDVLLEQRCFCSLEFCSLLRGEPPGIALGEIESLLPALDAVAVVEQQAKAGRVPSVRSCAL